nr:hypothetical protein [Streptomyces dysideae]
MLLKSAIHVAVFSLASARVTKVCRWTYSTLRTELSARKRREVYLRAIAERGLENYAVIDGD